MQRAGNRQPPKVAMNNPFERSAPQNEQEDDIQLDQEEPQEQNVETDTIQ